MVIEESGCALRMEDRRRRGRPRLRFAKRYLARVGGVENERGIGGVGKGGGDGSETVSSICSSCAIFHPCARVNSSKIHFISTVCFFEPSSALRQVIGFVNFPFCRAFCLSLQFFIFFLFYNFIVTLNFSRC